MNNHPALSTDKDAHNAMGDYVLWQGALRPAEHRAVRTVMRHGQAMKIIEVYKAVISQTDIGARRNMFVNRMRSVLAAFGAPAEETNVDSLRLMWAEQGFDPEVIEHALTAYVQEEAALVERVAEIERDATAADQSIVA